MVVPLGKRVVIKPCRQICPENKGVTPVAVGENQLTVGDAKYYHPHNVTKIENVIIVDEKVLLRGGNETVA